MIETQDDAYIPDKDVTVRAATSYSFTGIGDSLMVDPPGYIAPDQQDLMLIDITSTILHSKECTASIGRGNQYLSRAKSFPLEWPATGVVYGYNKRLMISLPCRRRGPNNKVLNIFFLVDTGSPMSYLCREAMTALIGDPTRNVPAQLFVAVQNESFYMPFFMSPLGTKEVPGHFRDANVLGMDFLQRAGLCMTVHTPIDLFRLFKSDDRSMFQDYSAEDLD
ncbi:hypothetical protein FisN_17Hu013 [Fistulifera solaris]|uniref:Uncharacterized protein n=1 Tax=Fistulifera solaris TaxID=1519565 RepID=A0A1Z5JGN2_FISSO|nr:hypothetical protein FisN_17Hu013 [Fistulifera solaris]|eukprot:GAX13086.1 hypothetical protein FisN_17Hu013 [Fistulifera solaris]